MKCELQETRDELKSAQLIIDSLVREINVAKASMGASTNGYRCKYNGRDFSSDESNRAGINNWIPVKNSQTTKGKKKKHTAINLITLSNNSAVLGKLCESSDKATNILKVHKALHVQRKRPKTPKKHSVLLVADCHIRGVAERLAIKLRSSFHIIGYVKPNANLNNITTPMKSEFRNLSKSDVVVLCGCCKE